MPRHVAGQLGETFLTTDNDFKQEEYELYNVRVGFQASNCDFYFFSENLSDELYFLDASPAGDGPLYGSVGRGRRLGAGMSLRF